ncbi:DUF2487 family protein [Paenibacillus sp. FSL K6-1096]|uniref:DUF2487 family protein n=1 Tax=Paenibacillus sp. FSL K6-1096 TaxID=2921460 RepID=UPI0030EB36A7
MKFSDFDRESWETNGHYYDTCVIPYSGLRGTETPPETVYILERQRDFLDLVEKPFQGRVVTYPAIQYAGTGSIALMNEICRKVKSIGFQYAIVLSANEALPEGEIHESDLVLCMPVIAADSQVLVSAYVRGEIQALWENGK